MSTDPTGIILGMIMISPILLAPFRPRYAAISVLTAPSWIIGAVGGNRLSLTDWSRGRSDAQCMVDSMLWAALAYEGLKAVGFSS